MRVGRLKLKLQLICGDGFAMGPGKADILEAIDRAGSISAAGRALGMSYRRTWLLVDEMNRCFSGTVVETDSGGARLSDLGRTALAAYRDLESQSVALTGSASYRRLTELLRDAPLPAKPVS
ncbi:MAG: LysR family transcriptional regulator [Bradyrhizobium sp.]|nr:LysR family transcriptional regulator [Bradyrhizobium sp.]